MKYFFDLIYNYFIIRDGACTFFFFVKYFVVFFSIINRTTVYSWNNQQIYNGPPRDLLKRDRTFFCYFIIFSRTVVFLFVKFFLSFSFLFFLCATIIVVANQWLVAKIMLYIFESFPRTLRVGLLLRVFMYIMHFREHSNVLFVLFPLHSFFWQLFICLTLLHRSKAFCYILFVLI